MLMNGMHHTGLLVEWIKKCQLMTA